MHAVQSSKALKLAHIPAILQCPRAQFAPVTSGTYVLACCQPIILKQNDSLLQASCNDQHGVDHETMMQVSGILDEIRHRSVRQSTAA